MYSQDIKDKAIMLYKDGWNTADISEELDVSIRTVQRYIRNYKQKESLELPDDIYSSNNRVLVIPDIHAPFTNKEYISWLKEQYNKWNCDMVVFMGDLIDSHTISSHNTSTSAMGTIDEYKKALDIVSLYTQEFPNAKYCMGNHDTRIMKQAAEVHLPKEFLKSFKELYNIPDTWEIKDRFIIDNVLYTHGEEFCSRNAITNVTSITHHSTVVAHSHTNFGIFYTNSGYDQLFCLCVGCLLDKDAYAFEYAKHNKYKPILGCGIVLGENEAYAIPYREEIYDKKRKR